MLQKEKRGGDSDNNKKNNKKANNNKANNNKANNNKANNNKPNNYKANNARKSRKSRTLRRTNRGNNLMAREINETDEMYRGRMEFIQLNQGKTTNNKSKNTNNKNKSASLEDIVNYSKVWLYKTFYQCTYSPEIEKKLKSFTLPKISLNH